jgi:hypothetical protein
MSSNVVDGNFSSLDVDRDGLTGPDRWVSGEDVVEGIREDIQTKFGADELRNSTMDKGCHCSYAS